jgi:MSHA biogenesis protein MshI
MFGWLQRAGRTPGLLAVTFDEARLEFVHARRGRGPTAQIARFAARDLNDSRTPIERVTRELNLGRYQCSTMLRAGEYDILLVDAPNVPRAEMKSALRWKVKGMVDYPVEEATLDFLVIPSDGAAEGRSQQLYAVLARNDLLQSRIRRFDESGVALTVIEIPDTAQRNIAALYPSEERGVALLYFGRNTGLLSISHGADLYLTRRLELGVEELAEDTEAAEGGAHDRQAFRGAAVAPVPSLRRRVARQPRMSQQINLFDARFRPQKPHFSAATMALAVLAVAVLCGVIRELYAHQNRSLEATLAQTETRVTQLREQSVRLARELSGQGRSTALADELARLEERLRTGRGLLGDLQGGATANVDGFSPYLAALARQTMHGVWLTAVEFGSGSGELVLKGRVLESELVPAYIQRLNREPLFKGRAVRELRLAAKGEAGKRYVEFSLQIPLAKDAS